MATIAQTPSRPRRSSALARREAVEGLLYISPFLLGFLIFTAYPMIASLYLSFTKYNIITAPTWIGLENYQEAFCVLKNPTRGRRVVAKFCQSCLRSS